MSWRSRQRCVDCRNCCVANCCGVYQRVLCRESALLRQSVQAFLKVLFCDITSHGWHHSGPSSVGECWQLTLIGRWQHAMDTVQTEILANELFRSPCTERFLSRTLERYFDLSVTAVRTRWEDKPSLFNGCGGIVLGNGFRKLRRTASCVMGPTWRWA